MKANKQLETAIDGYVDSWYNELSEDTKTKQNKQALRNSYEWVARYAVEAYLQSDDTTTKLYSAFPGTGKSHVFNTRKDIIVADSDSSTFDKSDFPDNYIRHIKSLIGRVDVLMISSHEDVRNALVDNQLNFTLVYPDISLKEEYLQRYTDRGSSESFINLLNLKWEEWITQCQNQKYCDHIVLKSGEYMYDVI